MGGTDALIGQIVSDDFRIVRQIAFGGYARIYLAEQLSVGKRKVALKVLHAIHAETSQAAVAALKREATFLAMMKSPCFPRIIRTGTTPNGLPYVALDFVTGRSVEAAIKESGVFAADRTVLILDEVAEGLAEMHARDILHRDVKPGNIVIEDGPNQRGRVKLLDLGNARSSLELDPSQRKKDPTLGGSPPYQAPETIASGVTNESTDQYSLGTVAYEMLTGIRAIHIKTSTASDYIDYLRSQQPIPTYRICTLQPDVPEALETVVQRALDRDPRKRFASVTEFRYALIEASGLCTRNVLCDGTHATPFAAPAGSAERRKTGPTSSDWLRRFFPLRSSKP